jgi:hypothetical protein
VAAGPGQAPNAPNQQDDPRYTSTNRRADLAGSNLTPTSPADRSAARLSRKELTDSCPVCR